MHDLDLLVPSALVDPGLAVELLRGQALPNVARFVAHARARESLSNAEGASLTPWQSWVFAHRAAVDAERVNIAESWAAGCGIAPANGRYLAEPAHFTIAKDHLRLDDPHALAITLPEAQALADAIAPTLADAGWRLEPIERATHWPMARTDGSPLSAPSIERAIGDNVAAWQPRAAQAAAADAALAWRRCVNEIQMAWFEHPVNAAREAAGRPAINTLWLSGNGGPRTAPPRYASVESSLSLLAALPIEPSAARQLRTFDGFVAPARVDDWSGWRAALMAFDGCLAATLREQRERVVGAITLVLCGRDDVRASTVVAGDFARFWRGWGHRAALSATFGESAA